MKCPYCNVFTNNKKFINGVYIYHCKNCGSYFHSSNPADKEPKGMEERMKFKDKGIVPKRNQELLNDFWIDLWEWEQTQKELNGNSNNL